jgi:tRNA 2-thiouridine synthesizing protein A
MVKFTKLEEGKYVLDVKGYTCPYPVIFTRKALMKIHVGEVLEVLTDNPPSCENVPKAVKEDGHDVLSVENLDRGVWKIIIVRRR